MSLFHTHTWEVTGSDYTAPSANDLKFGTMQGESVIKRAMDEITAARRGETHIYLKCATCGDIDSRTVPGKWSGEPKV